MIKNAHASETISSVRATEQFRSRRAAPDCVAAGLGADLAGGFAVWTFAAAGISTVSLRGLIAGRFECALV